jgi:membrane-associated phospholipid phosphatase
MYEPRPALTVKSSVRRRSEMAAFAALTAAGVGLSGWLAGSSWGSRIDVKVQNVFAASTNSGMWQLAFQIDDLLKTVVLLGGGLACLIALLSRGLRTAIAIAIVVVIAGGLAELLKQTGLVVPPSRVLAPDGPSWPSVHASALAALAISVVFLPRLRLGRLLVASAAGLGLVLACICLMIIRSHEPADLLGGCLLGAFVFGAVAALMDPYARNPRPPSSLLRRMLRWSALTAKRG